MPGERGRVGDPDLGVAGALSNGGRGHVSAGWPQQTGSAGLEGSKVGDMESWGVASFENDGAIDWFWRLEEATDPGEFMAQAIDDVVGSADPPDIDACINGIAAAELCACCAGHPPVVLPDRIHAWTFRNPHAPHTDEIASAAEAVTLIRAEGALREFWEDAGDYGPWSVELDDLLARLGQSSAGSPPSLSP